MKVGHGDNNELILNIDWLRGNDQWLAAFDNLYLFVIDY